MFLMSFNHTAKSANLRDRRRPAEVLFDQIPEYRPEEEAELDRHIEMDRWKEARELSRLMDGQGS